MINLHALEVVVKNRLKNLIVELGEVNEQVQWAELHFFFVELLVVELVEEDYNLIELEEVIDELVEENIVELEEEIEQVQWAELHFFFVELLVVELVAVEVVQLVEVVFEGDNYILEGI